MPTITLVSPASGATTSDNTPELQAQYGDAVNTGSITFEIDITTVFNSPDKQTGTITDLVDLQTVSWSPGTALGDRTWYWRAKAVNSLAEDSGWSTARSLNINSGGVPKRSLYQYENVGIVLSRTNKRTLYQYETVSILLSWTNKRTLYQYETVIAGSIFPPPGTATAQAVAPSISTGSTISPPQATAQADGIAPDIIAGNGEQTDIPTATAIAEGVSPSVFTIRNITIQAAIGTATAQRIAPTVQVHVGMLPPPGTAQAQALIPTIITIRNVTITVPTATSQAVFLVPILELAHIGNTEFNYEVTERATFFHLPARRINFIAGEVS